MVLFPFYQDIEKKRFLIIGGGAVAEEKIGRLRQFTERITVVARHSHLPYPVLSAAGRGIREVYREAAKQDKICVIEKCYEEEDLVLGDYVIGTTSDRGVNRKIAQDCRNRGIPVNIADDRELCTFVFPALVKKGALTIGITTNGRSPAVSSYLRRRLEEELPENMEEIVERMGTLRSVLPRYISRQSERKKAYREIFSLLMQTGGQAGETEIFRIIRAYADLRESSPAEDRKE
jgi:siroheme synthase-like protein